MKINENLVEIKKVTELISKLPFMQSFFSHCGDDGVLYKATLDQLATFLAPYITAVGGSGFVATTGTALPAASAGKFTIVGAGTYTQTSGNVTVSDVINILAHNGVKWTISNSISASTLVTKIEHTKDIDNINKLLNLGVPIDITGSKGGNLINAKTGAITANGSFESSGFLQVDEGDILRCTLRMQKTTTISSGIAGYSGVTAESFVSQTAPDGMAFGEVLSLDKLSYQSGVPILDSVISVKDYLIVIPVGSGIKYIRPSSLINGDVVLKITKYDSTASVSLKSEILKNDVELRKNRLKIDRIKRDLIRSTVQFNYNAIPFTLLDDWQVRANFGGIRQATGHKYTDFIDTYPYQIFRVSLTTYGTLNLPDGAAITGIAGYDVNGNFISELDEYGIPIGTVWSNDRYFQRTGLARSSDAVKHTKVEIVVPDKVYKIRISSQYSGAFAMPITLEVGSAIGSKTVKEVINEYIANAGDNIVPGNFQSNKGIKVIAHRGLWNSGPGAPENSMDAFLLACRFGYKHIEIDTVRTSDGQWVVLHDSTLDRTFRKASDYTAISGVSAATNTLSTLRSNYVHISDKLRMRRPIPILMNFLLLCKKFGVVPFIEVKDLPEMTNSKFLELFNLCKSVLGEEGFYLMAFSNFEFLDYLRTVSKKVKLVYFGSDVNRAISAKNAVYAMAWSSITPSIVKQCHDGGIEIAGWTVPANRYWDMSNIGVDNVICEGIAPELNNQEIVLVVSSDLDFTGFTTTGIISDGIATLSEGQTLTYLSPVITGLMHSGQYLSVDVRGNCTCAITDYNHACNNTDILDDYKTITHQILRTSNAPKIVFTAGAGGCQLKDITFKVVKF